MAREQHSGGTAGGSELGRFLRARRARVTPADVGLPQGPGRRRTPGLRREELATLAGVSIDYYTRLERGKENNPSPSVVDSLAAALRLEESGHEHLRDLAAHAARSTPAPSAVPGPSVHPGVELLLEAMRPNPAHVVSRTMEVVATNPGGLRLMAGLEDWPVKQRNIVRYVFLHPAARALFDDWENQIRGCVARLRTLAGIEPGAPDLTGLVDELLLKSPDFARLWEAYDVQGHSSGLKTFHHPRTGDVTLGYQSMQLEGTPGHRLVAYYAAPGTPEYDAMLLLDAAVPEDAGKTSAHGPPAGSPAAGGRRVGSVPGPVGPREAATAPRTRVSGGGSSYGVVRGGRCRGGSDERRRVDHEAVAHVGGQDPLVGLVDLVGRDDLDLGADAVPGAEVEHLLCLTDAADQRTGVRPALHDQREHVQ